MRGPCNQSCGRDDNLTSLRGGPPLPPSLAHAFSHSLSTPSLLSQKSRLKARRKQPDFVGRDTALFKGGREEQDLSRLR